MNVKQIEVYILPSNQSVDISLPISYESIFTCNIITMVLHVFRLMSRHYLCSKNLIALRFIRSRIYIISFNQITLYLSVLRKHCALMMSNYTVLTFYITNIYCYFNNYTKQFYRNGRNCQVKHAQNTLVVVFRIAGDCNK